jgi:hypothetical protein
MPLNADLHHAFGKQGDVGNTLAVLNTYLDIDRYNYSGAYITLCICNDEA